MRGMTAYWRAVVHDDMHEVTVELTSVNKRHLDIVCRLPKELQYADSHIKRIIGAQIQRGSISLMMRVRPLHADAATPTLNWAWIDGQKEALCQIAQRLKTSVSMEQICYAIWKEEKCFLEEDQTIIPEALLYRAVEEALQMFCLEKEREGQFIRLDFLEKIALLKKSHSSIALASKDHVHQIQERIQQLLAPLVPDSLVHDDRVMREIVLYADRADISEELDRIAHHLQHIEQVCLSTTASGKMVEFILQELLREWTTLGSKTAHASVSTEVIAAKCILEKMREQAQNVE